MTQRNDKQLDTTRAAAEHQKAWFAGLRRDVFEARQPYAIVQADMPLELFSVIGCPGRQQSVVGGGDRGQTAFGALPRHAQRAGLSRRTVPLLQSRTGLYVGE